MPNSRITAAVSLALWWGVFSCTTMNPAQPEAANDRLSAEYSQIKKHLPLLERENEVLKEESLQYRLKVRQLDATCEKLTSSLAELNAELEQAAALNAMSSNSLQEQIEQNRQAGIEEIRAQAALNQDMSEKLSARIQGFNQSLALQKNEINKALDEKLAVQKNELGKALDEQAAALKTAFSKTAALAQTENDEKQAELAGQIDVLKQSLSSKDAQIAALQRTAGELSLKLDAAVLQIEEINRVRSVLQSELQMVKVVETELLQQLKSLTDELNKKNVVLR